MRLIVASNRLPYDRPTRAGRPAGRRNVGGLVNALEPVLAARGGGWVGWDGLALDSTRQIARAMRRPVAFLTPTGVDLECVPLTGREISRYYHGFSNRALWPLLHGFVGRAAFLPEDFGAYREVNRRFARRLATHAQNGARLWIHDFHLMLVPRMLRELNVEGRLDFFLHVPFPALEIFRALPWREAVVQGLLASDTAAFHVPLYRDNFVAAAVELGGAEVVRRDAAGDAHLRTPGGRCVARAIPIGIDVDDFERLANDAAVRAHARRLRQAYDGCHILFSADRLDYTKGIRERLRAVERFLTLNPTWKERVVLVQIVVPSRSQVEEYRALKQEIDRVAGRINAENGREGWMPIHYRYAALERRELVAWYLAADAAVVTPLRDGMNLVAGEFAAARLDGDGVLVLSEFAGIATRAPGALLVNPFDLNGMARTLSQALEMPLAERRRRMATLRARVVENPASRWARRCLDDRPS